MIAIVYNVLARNEEYVELGADYYDQRNKPKTVSRLVARLMKLGYYVDLKPADPDLPQQAPLPELPIEEPSVAMVHSSHQPHTAVARTRKRGRPCKCAERGRICTHQTSIQLNSLIRNTSSTGTFS